MTEATRRSLVRVPLKKRLNVSVVHVGIAIDWPTPLDCAFQEALEERKQFVLASEVKKAMAEEESTEGLDIR